MNLLDEMRRLHTEGRLGHAYVCAGDPTGEGLEFATNLAAVVLGESERNLHRIATRSHPDVTWVEPRGKLQMIVVDDLNHTLMRVHEKSFEGGWKVVVFLGAERMNPASGNRLLKTLEEPPADTLILLVTDSAESLLPTLRSRCQVLSLASVSRERPQWVPALLDLLEAGAPRSLRTRLVRAAQFRDFLDGAAGGEMEESESESDSDPELEQDIENARETRSRLKTKLQVMAAVEAWYRDVLVCKLEGDETTLHYPDRVSALRSQAEGLPVKSIHKLLQNVHQASLAMQGNLPVQVVLEGNVF